MEVFPAFIETSDDFKELWESELDPAMQEVLRLDSSDMEWSSLDKDLTCVILQDRLMTDAVLGHRPIKNEHSYSLTSDGDSLPNSPLSASKLKEMDDDCFPSVHSVCERLNPHHLTIIKDEPLSETDSIHSSCPSSPQSTTFMNTSDLHYDLDQLKPEPVSKVSPPSQIMHIIPQRLLPQITIKTETGAFHLPPTPPSCSSSEDSEDNMPISQPASPHARKNAARVLLASTRQPIHTPLISSQPKGSTGMLILTEEEKRTLIAEGYSVPTRLPLTKAEEKSLKKIRRKIKNKISAQESRRKKKEYMDQLERKVELLVTENADYRNKIENLESSNSGLMSQLQKLQAIVARTHPQFVKQK